MTNELREMLLNYFYGRLTLCKARMNDAKADDDLKEYGNALLEYDEMLNYIRAIKKEGIDGRIKTKAL